MTPFRLHDIPGQSGKTVLVTGANTGIGFEIARHLAARGARVLLGCRSRDRGVEAVVRIKEEQPHADAEALVLDLADMSSIRAAAEQVQAEAQLDVLVNNAGLMMPPLGYAHGVEQQFGVNHLGHFALTALLLDKLAADGGGRVAVQSSIAHRRGWIDFANLDAGKGYARQTFYSQSKLANLLFAFELDRRLRAAGRPVKAIGCHPGLADSEISRHLGPAKVIGPTVGLFLNSAEDGALPALQAATDPALEGGEYLGPYGLMELRGRASGAAHAARSARHPDLAMRLWLRSEELTGINPDLRPA